MESERQSVLLTISLQVSSRRWRGGLVDAQYLMLRCYWLFSVAATWKGHLSPSWIFWGVFGPESSCWWMAGMTQVPLALMNSKMARWCSLEHWSCLCFEGCMHAL